MWQFRCVVYSVQIQAYSHCVGLGRLCSKRHCYFILQTNVPIILDYSQCFEGAIWINLAEYTHRLIIQFQEFKIITLVNNVYRHVYQTSHKWAHCASKILNKIIWEPIM